MQPEPEIEEQTAKRSKLPRIIFFIAVIGLAVWIFSGKKEEDKKNAPAVPVTVANVERRDIPYYLTGVGTVQSPHSVEVRSRIDGELTKIYFTEGQDVKQGELLAEIDSRAIRADLAQAKAQRARASAELETAKLDKQRYDNLLKADAIAKQTADTQSARVKQLQASWNAANAAIEANQVLLSYTKITSPVSGRVGIRRVDAGNIVKASDADGIVKVTQIKPINTIFTISQNELPQIKKAMQEKARQEKEIPVDAMLKDGSEIIATGKLQAIDNEIDETSGTIRLRAVFANENNELWPGQLIVLRTQAGIHKDAKVIPVKAVQRGLEGNFVYVVKDGIAEVTKVDIEHEDAEIAVISNGLTFEDKVVVDGQMRLKDGAKVKLPEEKRDTKLVKEKQPQNSQNKKADAGR